MSDARSRPRGTPRGRFLHASIGPSASCEHLRPLDDVAYVARRLYPSQWTRETKDSKRARRAPSDETRRCRDASATSDLARHYLEKRHSVRLNPEKQSADHALMRVWRGSGRPRAGPLMAQSGRRRVVVKGRVSCRPRWTQPGGGPMPSPRRSSAPGGRAGLAPLLCHAGARARCRQVAAAADAIIADGIGRWYRRVYEDPNHEVAGRHAKLRAAGIAAIRG